MQAWSIIHNRKLTEEVFDTWCGLFAHNDVRVLDAAIKTASLEAERMPTPGVLSQAINHAREQMGIFLEQRGEKQCDCKLCDGTGYKIERESKKYAPNANYEYAVKCDCHLEHALNSRELDAVDANGTMCWVDSRTGKYQYRAVDCPEGVDFLALLSKVSGQHDLAQWYENKMSTNRPEYEHAVITKRQAPIAGTVECEDCKQRYPAKEYFEHACPTPRKRHQRT